MALANCLKLKSQFYHGRVKVPVALVHAIGRKELLRTLRTRDPVTARRRARIFWLRCDDMFQALTHTPGLSRAQVQEVIDHFLDDALWLAEERLALGQTVFALPPGPDPLAADDIDMMERQARDGLARHDYALVTEQARALSAARGIAFDGPDGQIVSRSLMRAVLTLTEEVRRRRNGDYAPPPVAATALPLAPAIAQPVPVPTPMQVPPQPAPAASANDSPFHDKLAADAFALWADYRHEMLTNTLWTKHTDNQNACSLRFFTELHGTVGARRLQRHHVGAYQSMLCDIPSLNGKSPRWRDVTGPQMAATVRAAKERIRNNAATADDTTIGATLSPKTVRRHISALSGYWTWLVDKGYVSGANPFDGFQKRTRKGRKKGNARDERKQWDEETLQALFTSPVWRGCRNPLRRATPGDKIIRDEKFWLPLIALYSGMRLEEIAQLRVRDVRCDNDIWLFDIRDDAGRLKNEASKRLVPVHATLLRMGLVAERVKGKDRDQRLFPELSPRGDKKKLGIRITKWFGRYRQQIGVYERWLDFHSLRHTVSTLLGNTPIVSGWKDELLGHESDERRSEGNRYTKLIWLTNLKTTVDAIDPGVDFSHLFTQEE